MPRRTRILLGVTLALVAWFALTVRWATQPLTDAVPVGKDANGWQRLAAEPGACVHLYGKHEARAGRKMGHVTRLSAKTA